jgi:glycosyltransferase involved in cell wall biosynthesis
MPDKLISIVIPAYNESENIPKIVPVIQNLFKSLTYMYEIIMVADGCTDN